MWDEDSASFEAIQSAETALLSSDVRSNAAQLRELLAEDFVEIGRSGRRWSRSELIAALREERPRPAPATSEWLFNRLGAELILVTYRIHGPDHDSRHTSLWDITGPALRFHQGTVIPNE